MPVKKAAILERLHAIKRELEDLIDNLAEDEPPAPAPAAGRKLAIVVGHTRTSPGVFGQAPVDQHEYFWNSGVAERMKQHAGTIPGLAVEIFLRDQGGIAGAYGRAKTWGAEASIELHFNAANGRASGTETIYVTDRSKPLAQAVQQAMVATMELRDRKIKLPWEGRGNASLTQLAVPSIIVEPFFGDNAGDCERAVAKRDDLATAIVDAANEALGG